jgi:ribosome maturation factor RimP
MLNESGIRKLVNEHFAGTDNFLVEVLIKPANRIYIFIDGDHGVTISDCVELSRFIESQFDRETEDFELNVSSFGADHPIRMPRQYIKNIGRSMQVKLSEENIITGKLEAVDDKGITLVTTGDKKKKLPPETLNLHFEDIIESKVIISFK